MKINKELKPSELKLFAKVSLTKQLYDVRPGRRGMSFGTVENVCRQYGISYKKTPSGFEFSAPKLRLQMLMEKLHFSRINYHK